MPLPYLELTSNQPLLTLAYGGRGIVDELVVKPWAARSTRVRVVYTPDVNRHRASALLRLESGIPKTPESLDKPWAELTAGDCLAAHVTPAFIHETLYYSNCPNPKPYVELLCAIAVAEAVRKGSGAPIFIDPLSGYGIPEHVPGATEQRLVVLQIGTDRPTTVPALVHHQVHLPEHHRSTPAVLHLR